MKAKYKYIHFEQAKSSLVDKPVFYCRNNKSNSILAGCLYDNKWKQYVVKFNQNAIFSSDCLKDIADFLKQLNKSTKIDKNNDIKISMRDVQESVSKY
jgi:hypothetical protein